jgi:hypothetical protein
MSIEISINEAVDKLITTHETTEIETKKRPLFFRIFSEPRIPIFNVEDQEVPFTVMKVPMEAKMVDGKSCMAGLGDSDTIERVIRRHEITRKSIVKRKL